MMGWNAIRRVGCGVVIGAVLAITGCMWSDGPPADQMNSAPQGTSPTGSRCQEHYVAMTDNALLNDATMSAIHFVPRTAELNALGVRRLTRMAEVLKVYGGTVMYDGTESDRDLRKDRMDKIRSYLVSCGLASNRFNVEPGFAGGAGMDADEAIAIRKATRGPGDVQIKTECGGDTTGGSAGGGSQ